MDFLGILLCNFNKFDFKDIFLLTIQMDQLGKPIEVNRKFIKFIEEVIQSEYERVLNELVEQLKREIDNQVSIETTKHT